MRYLVTGSSGHLGEALVRTLRARGDGVVGLDIRPSPSTTLVGSIDDPRTVRHAMEGTDVVLHPAALHKPHLATHSRREFVDVNVTGTLTLLEAAVAANVAAFVLTSTTSVFGRALEPRPGAPAAWITEETVPLPKNIYGATKLAAEHLAEEIHHSCGLPVVVLRTSRFFSEPDDREEVRRGFDDANQKVNELLHRRIDIADVVLAHLTAAVRAPDIGFGRYIVSATTPFEPDDLPALRTDPVSVVAHRFPDQARLYAAAGWTLPGTIDRVYVNDHARDVLGWDPTYDFAHVLRSLREDQDWRSPLAADIGIKGYHGGAYPDGLYPVDRAPDGGSPA